MNFSIVSNFSDAKLVLEKCVISYAVHSPTPSYTRNNIAACVVNLVFAVVGTILNSLVLYIFWKSTKIRSKSSYFVIMLLSSADLAVATIVHSTFLLQAIKEVNGTATCAYKVSYLSTLYFFTGISIATLLLLNLERYTAIIHPIWHRKRVTRPRVMFIWTILWLVIIVNTVSRLIYRPVAEIITVILISSLCLTSLVTYASIFRVARKKKSITLCRCNALGDRANCDNCQREAGNMAAFLREIKMAKTYFTIIVVAFVCFLPAAIFVKGIKYPWNESEDKRLSVTIAYAWVTSLTSMNSTLNCLIFFWANKMLRSEALKLFKRSRSSSTETTSQTSRTLWYIS